MAIFTSFAKVKGYLLFWLCFMSLVGVFALAFNNDTDVTIVVPAILSIYAAHSFGKSASAHFNARQDPDADVEKVIEATNDR